MLTMLEDSPAPRLTPEALADYRAKVATTGGARALLRLARFGAFPHALGPPGPAVATLDADRGPQLAASAILAPLTARLAPLPPEDAVCDHLSLEAVGWIEQAWSDASGVYAAALLVYVPLAEELRALAAVDQLARAAVHVHGRGTFAVDPGGSTVRVRSLRVAHVTVALGGLVRGDEARVLRLLGPDEEVAP